MCAGYIRKDIYILFGDTMNEREAEEFIKALEGVNKIEKEIMENDCEKRLEVIESILNGV